MFLAKTIPHPEHRVFPYLLRDVQIERHDQVWSTDITYIRMRHGFLYLVAIMDCYSRHVLSWRLSNTLDTAFCIEALEAVLTGDRLPEIFNSDQGSQFTSNAFVERLLRRGILVSMDGKGRAFDNIFTERLWRSVKYIENLEDLGVLKVHPFTRFGTPVEIIRLFGGKAQFMQAVLELQKEIYSAG